MSTGIESWSSIKYMGAIYPFVGSEVLFIVIAVVIWIVWQVWQFRSENRTYEEQTRNCKEIFQARYLEIKSLS